MKSTSAVEYRGDMSATLGNVCSRGERQTLYCHSTQLSEGKPAMGFPSLIRSLRTTETEVS
jgi:hypothetical protein